MSPNGLHRTEDEQREIEEIFSPIASVVNILARQNGVRLTKYDRGTATWILQFARKLGGIATITIGLNEDTRSEFYIVAIWWVDEYETSMRHSVDRVIGCYRRSEPLAKLAQLLDDAIWTVRNWTSDDLRQHDGPMENWKSTWPTKDLFEQAVHQNYPVVDI